MWTEKHRPKHTDEVKGQEGACLMLKQFVSLYPKQPKKACFLYGPAGTGKTALVYALATEIGYEVVELNSSDFRHSESIKAIVKPAMQQATFFSSGRIILIEDIDAMHFREDRGGLKALLNQLGGSTWPVVLTTNDVWQRKLNELRRKALLIEMKRPAGEVIKELLKEIASREGIQFRENIFEILAERARGDARAAINDLQVLSMLGGITPESVEAIGERQQDENIFNALRNVFKSGRAVDALRAFDSVNIPLDECILWLDENLPLEYSGKELSRAYEALSKADVFRGRIRRWQYWRFLVYVNVLCTAGVAASRSAPDQSYTAYKKVSRILKLWMAKQKNARRKEIAKKLAKATHCSVKKAYKELPLLEAVMKASPEVAKELKLTSEEFPSVTSK